MTVTLGCKQNQSLIQGLHANIRTEIRAYRNP